MEQINLLLFTGQVQLTGQIKQQVINYILFKLIYQCKDDNIKLCTLLQQQDFQLLLQQQQGQKDQLGLSNVNQIQETQQIEQQDNILGLEIQLIQQTIQIIQEVNILCQDNQQLHQQQIYNYIKNILDTYAKYSIQDQTQLQTTEQWLDEAHTNRKNFNLGVIKQLISLCYLKYVESCYWFSQKPDSILCQQLEDKNIIRDNQIQCMKFQQL